MTLLRRRRTTRTTCCYCCCMVLVLSTCYSWTTTLGFAPLAHTTTGSRRSLSLAPLQQARRYGPPPSLLPDDDDDEPLDNKDDSTVSSSSSSSTAATGSQNNNSKHTKEQQQQPNQAILEKFQTLIDKIQLVSNPNHLPSLLAQNVPWILQLSQDDVSKVVQSILAEGGDDEDSTSTKEDILTLIFDFCQDFVEETAAVHDTNRQLLGRILKTMADKTQTGGQREEALDQLLQKEGDNLTPGFLRHVAGECERIEQAPKMTPESIKLLETLRVVQARVVDEMGQNLGDAAQVIMQLLNYETKGERIAVLEAGLTVRGSDFAQELLDATEEALQGFQNVPAQQVDPELVQRVREIRDRTKKFVIMDESTSYQ